MLKPYGYFLAPYIKLFFSRITLHPLTLLSYLQPQNHYQKSVFKKRATAVPTATRLCYLTSCEPPRKRASYCRTFQAFRSHLLSSILRISLHPSPIECINAKKARFLRASFFVNPVQSTFAPSNLFPLYICPIFSRFKIDYSA